MYAATSQRLLATPVRFFKMIAYVLYTVSLQSIHIPSCFKSYGIVRSGDCS